MRHEVVDGAGSRRKRRDFLLCGSFETLDVEGLQEFALDAPVDTTAVRIVCQSIAFEDDARCCGLLQVTLF